MKTVWLILLTAALSAFGLQTDSDQRIQKAQSAAEQWLKLVDSGAYDQSWQTASEIFKLRVSKEQWGKGHPDHPVTFPSGALPKDQESHLCGPSAVRP